MKKNHDLKRIEFTTFECETLPLNHRVTYTKDIPSAEAYAQAKLVNTKYRFHLNMPVASKKPISKMGVFEDEHQG